MQKNIKQTPKNNSKNKKQNKKNPHPLHKKRSETCLKSHNN